MPFFIQSMDQKLLETMVRESTAVNLVGAACLTLLVYDHILTLDVEVSKMWPMRISLAKFLFFLNRYLIEAALLFDCISASRTYLSRHFCTFYMRWLSVVSISSTIIIQGILVLRVWALHRRNQWALRVAFFFYFGGCISLLGLLVTDYVGEKVNLNMALTELPGCYATSVPSIIAGQWVVPLIVETVFFCLVGFRAYTWWKDGIATPKIFSILARDSTIYFSVVFVLLLSNFLVFQLGPPFLSSLLVTPSTTAGCILGSHMLLNLRETQSDPLSEEFDTPSGVAIPTLDVNIPVQGKVFRGVSAGGDSRGSLDFPYTSYASRTISPGAKVAFDENVK